MAAAVALFAGSLNYIARPRWLTLSACSGAGKTMLARALWRQFMEQNRFELKFNRAEQRTYGNTGMFCDWRKFCDQIRSGAYELIEDLSDEWFVIIDDLGAERDTTGFIASATDRIFNSRRGKWTFITSNLTVHEIADRVDPRVASRMLRDGNQVIEVATMDFNLRDEKRALL